PPRASSARPTRRSTAPSRAAATASSRRGPGAPAPGRSPRFGTDGVAGPPRAAPAIVGGMDDRARVPADVAVSEMEALLSLALGRGGDFADLYFEHEKTSSLVLEEGIIRSASAGVSCGLGVRVVSGERTGYAYTDDLSPAAMKRAAETAAHIASGGRTLPPEPVSPAGVEPRYGADALGGLSLAERIALVDRADRAARAFDPRVDKVIVSLGEETKLLRIANSAGVLVEDAQPLFSIRVSVI